MKKSITFICISFALTLVSCTNQPADELVLPTRIYTPTETATPILTATPTALVLADHGEQTEPYPELEVITAGNVHRLEEVDVWGKGTVMGVALSPDASTIAVSTATGIYFYDADSMEQIDWIDFAMAQIDYGPTHPYLTYDNLDFSPDGKSLLVGFDNLYIVDLETKAINQFEMTETEIDRPFVIETTYSKNGKYILVNRAPNYYGFLDMFFEIYEVNSASVVFQYDFKLFDSNARIHLIEDHYAIIHQIMVDVNNGEIIEKEEIYIDDTKEQKIIFEQLQENQWQVTLPMKDLICIFNGNNIQGNMSDFSEDQLTWIVFNKDYSELNILHFDSCQKSEQAISFPEAFGEFSISSQGNFVITDNYWGNYQCLWDVYTGEAITFQEADKLFFDAYDSQLFSMKGASSWEEKKTETNVTNVVSGEVLFQIEEESLRKFAMNPKDTSIFFLNDNLINGSQTNQIVKQYGEYPYQFSQDGKFVVYLVKQSNHPYVFLYFDSVFSGELVHTETMTILLPSASSLDNIEIEDFQFSNTGRYVVFFGQNEFWVWDLIDEKPVVIHDGTESGYVYYLKFSPDDELLFTREAPYGSGKIRVYDLKIEQVIYDIIQPKILSSGPAISPDGKFLAFLGYDGTIRIYGVK